MSDKNTNTAKSYEDEFDAILPDGWSGNEDADIFDPSTWGTTDTESDVTEDETAEGEGNSQGEADDLSRAIEEGTDSQAEPEETEESPATADDGSPKPIKVRVTIDHVPQDVEIDPSDIPSLYEKSQALDRYKQRLADAEAEQSRWDALAAGLQFENRGALLDGLIENAVQDYISEHPSIPEEMARDYFMRRFKIPEKQEQKQEQPAQETGQRDYRQEVADLFRTYPEARTIQIPDDVKNDAIQTGKPLVQAYADWKARTASAEASRANRENKILRQNQAAAARAPVKKTTGGGKTDNSPEDPFLKGFNDDDRSW